MAGYLRHYNARAVVTASESKQDPITAIILHFYYTANADQVTSQSYGVGADDYLRKATCTLKELLASITTRLEKQTVLRQCGGWPPKSPRRHLLILQAWQPRSRSFLLLRNE